MVESPPSQSYATVHNDKRGEIVREAIEDTVDSR